MKNQVSLISRLAVVALASGGLYCSNAAFGQTEADSPSPSATAETTATPADEPLTSMAPSKVKPSKAELAKKKQEHGAMATAAAGNPKAASMAQLGAKDRSFMAEAAKGGMKEVQMGQMAEKQGQSPQVKKLAKMIVADHTRANSQLMSIAQAKGVKLDTRHKMEKLSADKFDQEWLSGMAADHQKTIALFEGEASNGADPQLKSFAAKTLPTLKKHLKKVQAAQAKMPKMMKKS